MNTNFNKETHKKLQEIYKKVEFQNEVEYPTFNIFPFEYTPELAIIIHSTGSTIIHNFGSNDFQPLISYQSKQNIESETQIIEAAKETTKHAINEQQNHYTKCVQAIGIKGKTKEQIFLQNNEMFDYNWVTEIFGKIPDPKNLKAQIVNHK